MYTLNLKIILIFCVIIPNITYNDTINAVEYTYDGNLQNKSLEDLKLFNGDDLIFNEGLIKKIKIVSQGLKINNIKDGDWIYFDDDGFVNKIITYKYGTKLKVIKLIN